MTRRWIWYPVRRSRSRLLSSVATVRLQDTGAAGPSRSELSPPRVQVSEQTVGSSGDERDRGREAVCFFSFQTMLSSCASPLTCKPSPASGTGADTVKKTSASCSTRCSSGSRQFTSFPTSTGLNYWDQYKNQHRSMCPICLLDSEAPGWTDWTECLEDGNLTDLCGFHGDESRKVSVKLSSGPAPLSRTFYTQEFTLNKSGERLSVLWEDVSLFVEADVGILVVCFQSEPPHQVA